jgi:ATP-dependent DNA helicase DinG
MSEPLADASARVFAAGGPLARVVPGFEPRPGQQEMAAAVADTLEAGGILLAEAGTGTGKTLAYLVPAIQPPARARLHRDEEPQEQIAGTCRSCAAPDIPFTATHTKGRANYLCLHRFEAFRRSRVQGPREPGR